MTKGSSPYVFSVYRKTLVGGLKINNKDECTV